MVWAAIITIICLYVMIKDPLFNSIEKAKESLILPKDFTYSIYHWNYKPLVDLKVQDTPCSGWEYRKLMSLRWDGIETT